jgi:RNA polymerase sigma factor (sigma-70 family)
MASTGGSLGSAGDREGLTLEEAQLARRAAEGDGAAFATLYDRYESRIYNFCNRLLGSTEDAADATQDAFVKVLQRLPKLEGRELNFSAYLYTAARNASYDMIGKRKRATPVDEIPEHGGGQGTREPGDIDIDPERTAMLDSLQAEIREANARLPERQREVLALREISDRSYDEIAEIMDMNRNSVAQLISRARIKLRDELRGTALASIAVSSPECERALPLIAARADNQLEDSGDAAWLESHLSGCHTCQVSQEAMEEAGASYRGWVPLVPLLWLRRETIAKAAERVGADWSEIANSPRPAGDGGPGGGAGAGDGGPGGAEAGGAGGAADGEAAVGVAAGEAEEPGRFRRTLRSRRRAFLALLGALALLLGVFVAIVVGEEGDAGNDSTSTDTGSQAGAIVPTTGTVPGALTTAKKGKKKTPTTDAGATVTTTTLPSGEVTTTTIPRRTLHKRPHRRVTNGGSRQGGGGGAGPIHLPTTSTPTASNPPPTTTAAPPTTTETPPPTTTTTTTTTPTRPCPPTGSRPCP